MYLLPVIVKKETTTNMIWLKLRLVFNKTFISSPLADMGWDLECILHTVGKTQHLPQLLSNKNCGKKLMVDGDRKVRAIIEGVAVCPKYV